MLFDSEGTEKVEGYNNAAWRQKGFYRFRARRRKLIFAKNTAFSMRVAAGLVCKVAVSGEYIINISTIYHSHIICISQIYHYDFYNQLTSIHNSFCAVT